MGIEKISFVELAESRFEEFLSKLPFVFFERLNGGGLWWTEVIEEVEVAFEVEVLEIALEHITIGLSVNSAMMEAGATSPATCDDIGTTFLIDRPQQRSPSKGSDHDLGAHEASS